jgi:1-acyl-sn-glycerol-3-phosphate acyltransferase
MPVDTLPEFSDPRNRKRYYFTMTPVRRVLTALAHLFFQMVANYSVSGEENLPALGAVVLAVNHLTNFDVFPIQFALPRPIFFMAKAELHRNPIMDLILRQLGTFPVERGAHDDWALEHALRVLAHGQVLGIFPEGKRNKGRGLQPAKTGAARIAIAANCPIVPMAIEGSQHMLRLFPRRTQVCLTIGQPLYPVRGETALALTDRLMFTLAEMLPPEGRGVYATRPPGF